MRKRWWLCSATDFQSLMYPCFICSRILGIFPYKLNASTFEISKLYCILSTVIICVCCVINFVIIDSLIESKLSYGDVVWDVYAVLYHTLTSFIVIVTYSLSVPRMRVLQTILEVSSKLSLKSYQKLSRLIHVKDIFVNILRIVQLALNWCTLREFKGNFLAIVIGVPTIYLALLILQINLLYVNCVCVLKACFKRINDSLIHMQSLIINDTNPRASNVLWHKNQCLKIELKVLKKQHLMISDAVQMLNMTFSMQVLTTIVMSILTITFDLYFYAIRWQNGVFFEVDWRSLDVLLTSLMYDISKITLFVWACETGKNQAQAISTTIHDLLNSTSDEKIKCELQLFSLQVLHRKNTFSMKGFSIDATLLATVSIRLFVVNIKIFVL
ncbi:Putative gustatory receptor 28b [Cyphomyrmex costatus]|uniref:Gustatory receptor n=1 Tax=Cyphomyrmex costatus TaxID=456900 RepID=A0A195CSY1_9HYME|nr:Putative gustatory receptor 28b [Cyphomyrmex costatus]